MTSAVLYLLKPHRMSGALTVHRCIRPDEHSMPAIFSPSSLRQPWNVSQLRNSTKYKECGDAFNLAKTLPCIVCRSLPWRPCFRYRSVHYLRLTSSEKLLEPKLPGQQVLAASVRPRSLAPQGWESFICLK